MTTRNARSICYICWQARFECKPNSTYSILLLLFCVLFYSAPSRADMLGTVFGRSANTHEMPRLAIELGGAWHTKQLRWSALRLNINTSRSVSFYLDFANVNVFGLPVSRTQRADYDGFGSGLGMIVSVPDPFASLYMGVHIAYHEGMTERQLTSATRTSSSDNAVHQVSPSFFQFDQFGIDLVLSPIDPYFENGVYWYTTAGYVSTDARIRGSAALHDAENPVAYQHKSGLSLGAGIVIPTTAMDFFVGYELLVDEPLFGLGMRYLFNK